MFQKDYLKKERKGKEMGKKWRARQTRENKKTNDRRGHTAGAQGRK